MYRKFYQTSFSLICWGTFMSMTMYWLYKYKVEDRDIAVLDLISLEEATEVEFPVLSICTIYPFVEKRFKDIYSGINISAYLDYLKGNSIDDSFKTVDYDKVTLNLGDYFLFATEKWKNDPDTLINSSLDLRHKNIFSGFNEHNRFFKCFAIEFDVSHNRHIKTIGFHYEKTKLLADWSQDPEGNTNWIPGQDLNSNWHHYDIKLHWKGQFLIGEKPLNHDFFDIDHFDYLGFLISELEVIERRNTNNKRCLNKKSVYDQSVLKNHILMKGCRAPYLNADNSFPVCNTTDDIKNAKLTYGKTKTIDHIKPCNRISKLAYERSYKNTYKDWSVFINFPEDVKTIVQSKEVDIHSLIGNVGGYLGLFMGYAIVQIPSVVFSIYDHFAAKP